MVLRLFGLIISASLLSPLAAAPSQKKEQPAKPAQERPAAEQPKEVSPDESPFLLTKDADVRLDGRPWAFEAIPADAIIMNMQVGPDRRTIVRVHFRSK
jgi:hypothetical protein